MNRSTKWLLGFALLAIAMIVWAAPPPGTYITSNFFTTNNADIIGTNGVTVSSNFIAGGNPAKGRYVIDGSALVGKTNIFNPNQFSQIGVGGTNVNIKSGALVTNIIVNGQTNIGPFTTTNPIISYGNPGFETTLRETGGAGFEIYSTDGGAVFTVTSGGNYTFGQQGTFSQTFTYSPATASTIAKFDGSKILQSVANGTGALTNDGSGGFGWFNNYLTLANATNNFGFNSSQFALSGTGGTNVSIKNGALLTNTTTKSSSTTTVPSIISLAGGHNTNAIEIQQGPAIVGGFDSNGIATMTISNATVVYPACYRVFNQTADGSCTNITTSETSWFGTGNGSLTLPAGFWQVGRSVKIEMSGVYFTPAAAGNTRIRLKLGSTAIATNVVATIPSSVVSGPIELRIVMTCRTNSTTGWIVPQGYFYKSTTSEGATLSAQYMRFTVTALDTTAAMAIDVASTNGNSTQSFTIQQANVTLIP